MSDLMLTAVLSMPYDMAMENELSRRQFWDRAQQALAEIERLTAERDELRRQLAEAEQDARRYRWLRNEANTARKCDPMVCIYPLDEQDLIDGDRTVLWMLERCKTALLGVRPAEE